MFQQYYGAGVLIVGNR